MKIHCKYDALVPWRQLKPHPKNRNKHSPEQIERLAKLIRYQGVRAPIVVSNLSQFIVKGHGTLMAMQDVLKTEDSVQVPVVYQDFDDEEQEYAFVQSDNAIAAWAELDLAGINADIGDLGPDFDIDLLGIKGFTLDVSEHDEGDPDEVPEPPKEAKTKTGELWALGEHRLLCGDSTKREDVERLMAGENPILMVTDPPYGVEYDPSWRQEAAIAGHLSKADRAVGKVTSDDRCEWSETIALFAPQVVYLWHDGRRAKDTQLGLEGVGYKIVSQIIWAKDVFAISRGDYHWKHEPCWYAVREGRTHNWQGSRSESTLWEITRGCKEKTGHGTEKPIECMERPVRNNTSSGQLVVDPFLGSGTTLIACQKTNRRCFGMEIDTVYCDVILSRWAKFTSKDPVRNDGVTWSELNG